MWGESRCCVSDVSVGGVCCRCVSYGCVSKGVWRCGLLLWMRLACRYFEVQPGGEVGVKNVRPEGDRGAALETKNHTRVVSAKEEEEQNKIRTRNSKNQVFWR